MIGDQLTRKHLEHFSIYFCKQVYKFRKKVACLPQGLEVSSFARSFLFRQHTQQDPQLYSWPSPSAGPWWEQSGEVFHRAAPWSHLGALLRLTPKPYPQGFWCYWSGILPGQEDCKHFPYESNLQPNSRTNGIDVWFLHIPKEDNSTPFPDREAGCKYK